MRHHLFWIAALVALPCFAPGVQTTRLDDGAPDQAVVVIERLRASARLDANQVAFLKRVDATCSIREIADLVTPSDARASLPLVHTMARDLFEYLWALDLIEVRLNPPPIPT